MMPDSASPPIGPSRRVLVSLARGGTRSPLAPWLDGASGGVIVVGGLLLVALIGLLDYGTGPYLSLSIFYLLPVAACAWWGGFPHGILLSLAGAVAWHAVDLVETPAIPPGAEVWNGIVRFGMLALVSSLVSRLHAGVLRERLLARTDALTGAANGRTFYETTAAESERSRRTSRPMTLAYLDLDNFKQLNDRLGHAVGDAALIHVVRTMHPNLRSFDVLARLGGDEFALLLPETGAEAAAALLDRVQQLLMQEMGRKGWPISLSVGAITFLRPSADLDLMIRRVDALMYVAKRRGKGRVEHAVLADAAQPWGEDAGGIERRAVARLLCDHAARVRPQNDDGPRDMFATVADISAGGVGVYLDAPVPRGTLLIVERLCPGAPPLLARVIHAAAEDGKWKHGCELSTRLGEDEVRRWLAEASTARASEVPVS